MNKIQLWQSASVSHVLDFCKNKLGLAIAISEINPSGIPYVKLSYLGEESSLAHLPMNFSAALCLTSCPKCKPNEQNVIYAEEICG